MPACQSRLRNPTTPSMQRLTAITHARFGLFRFRSPLLTESRLLSLPVGTEMFHFPTFPLPTLCVQVGVTGLASSRVSPFGNPRIAVWLSTPRGLSQIPTSFFGSWCQGIHRAPLKTWPQRCSRPLCSSQNTNPNHLHTQATLELSAVQAQPRQPDPPARSQQPARCLRTQQRATTPDQPPPTFPTTTPQKSMTAVLASSANQTRPIRCSTLEHPHHTFGDVEAYAP